MSTIVKHIADDTMAGIKCRVCGETIEPGEEYYKVRGPRHYRHYEDKPEGILDKVQHVNRKRTREEYGRTALDLTVLKRVLSPEQIMELTRKYNKATQVKKIRTSSPSDEDLALFDEHLNPAYAGKTFKEIADILKVDNTGFAYRMYRVAYWKHVIKTEVE